MNLAVLRTHLRARLDDEAGKKLWSDAYLDAVINAAYFEACERAYLIYDRAVIKVVAGKAVYAMSDVLGIDRLVHADDGRELRLTDPVTLDREAPGWEILTGRPSAAIFRETSATLKLAPVPTADATLWMDHYRLPKAPLEAKDSEPEIAARHHLRMLDWAIHLCFDRRDSDGQDDQRAALYDTRFTAAFGERRDANVQRKQADRRRHVVRPNPSW